MRYGDKHPPVTARYAEMASRNTGSRALAGELCLREWYRSGGLNATVLPQSLQRSSTPHRETNNAPIQCLSMAESWRRSRVEVKSVPDVVFRLGSLKIAAVSNLCAPIKPPGLDGNREQHKSPHWASRFPRSFQNRARRDLMLVISPRGLVS